MTDVASIGKRTPTSEGSLLPRCCGKTVSGELGVQIDQELLEVLDVISIVV